MSIVLAKADVAKMGGTYLPTKARAPEVAAPPPQPKQEPAQSPVAVHVHAPESAEIVELTRTMKQNNVEQTHQLERIASIMAKNGGSWVVTILSRDQNDQIKTMQFTQQG